MGNTTYSEKLKSPLWQKKRLEILSRDNFTCTLCSDTETELHVHHKEYKWGNEPWQYPIENFQTLCKRCHSVIEHFKDLKLIPIISSKYQYAGGENWIISTIFKHHKHGLVLAINYYCEKSNTQEFLTIMERSDFKGINSLFDHAEKLIK